LKLLFAMMWHGKHLYAKKKTRKLSWTMPYRWPSAWLFGLKATHIYTWCVLLCFAKSFQILITYIIIHLFLAAGAHKGGSMPKSCIFAFLIFFFFQNAIKIIDTYICGKDLDLSMSFWLLHIILIRYPKMIMVLIIETLP
jgi:hypothetical protein